MDLWIHHKIQSKGDLKMQTWICAACLAEFSNPEDAFSHYWREHIEKADSSRTIPLKIMPKSGWVDSAKAPTGGYSPSWFKAGKN